MTDEREWRNSWIKSGQSSTEIVTYLIKGTIRIIYGRIQIYYLLWRINQKLKKLAKKKKTATGRDQTVPAQIKAPPKVPAQRVDYKAARRQALEARQRINLQPKKKIGTRAEPEKFNMVKVGARRRELGAKANVTEAELREYKDLSNQIEAELEKKFKADEKKV